MCAPIKMCNLLLVFTIVGEKIGLAGTDTFIRLTQSLEKQSFHVLFHEKILFTPLS